MLAKGVHASKLGLSRFRREFSAPKEWRKHFPAAFTVQLATFQNGRKPHLRADLAALVKLCAAERLAFIWQSQKHGVTVWLLIVRRSPSCLILKTATGDVQCGARPHWPKQFNHGVVENEPMVLRVFVRSASSGVKVVGRCEFKVNFLKILTKKHFHWLSCHKIRSQSGVVASQVGYVWVVLMMVSRLHFVTTC